MRLRRLRRTEFPTRLEAVIPRRGGVSGVGERATISTKCRVEIRRPVFWID